jgi:hypothetical protein
MSKNDRDWDQYLALQTKLRASTRVNDGSWGVESALNRLLAADDVAADEVERTGRTSSRRERHQASLRRRYLGHVEVRCDRGESIVQARERLRLVKAATSDAEWALLSEIVDGTPYGEVAAAGDRGANVLRVRVSRLRQKLRAITA